MRIPVTNSAGFISLYDVRTLLADGELTARAYARTHRLNDSITRCCNNYAPYQYPRKAIPLFVTNRDWCEPLKQPGALAS